MIPCLWHGGSGNWDTAFPRAILDTAEICDHIQTLDAATEIPQSQAAICIPGRHSTEGKDYAKIVWAAAHFDQVTFIVYGDEESCFQAENLSHDDKRVWWFMPPFNPKQKVDRVAINGWPTGCPGLIAEQNLIVNGVRDQEWCFLGQVTHDRRQQCAEAAKKLPRGYFYATEGFTKGLTRDMYYRALCRSKIALCPSGPKTPDSFRLAEALEAGCVPIADECTPDVFYPSGYWQYAFGTKQLPFPIIRAWDTLPEVTEDILNHYARYFYSCQQFWQNYKIRLAGEMLEDLRR